MEFSFNDIFESLPLGIIVFDEDLQVLTINKNFYQFGIYNQNSTKNIIGESITEDFFQNFSLSAEFFNKIKNGISFETEMKNVQTLSNSKLSIILKYSPILENGIRKGGLIIIEDLKSEINYEPVEMTSQFYKMFCDSYLLIKPSSEILIFEGDKNNLPGFESLEVNLDQISNSKVKEFIQSNLMKALEEKSIIKNSIQIDENSSIEIKVIPELLENRKIIHLLITKHQPKPSQFISDKYNNEIQQYYAISNFIGGAVFTIDLNGSILTWNKACSELFLINQIEVYGKQISKILIELNRTELLEIHKEINASGIWSGKVSAYIRGQKTNLNLRAGFIDQKEANKIVFLIEESSSELISSDSSDEVLNRFEKIVLKSNSFFSVIDSDGMFKYINPAFQKFLGLGDDYHELCFSEFLHITSKSLLKNIDRIFTNFEQSNLELELRNNSGEIKKFIADFNPMTSFDGRSKLFTTVLIDISERKNIQKEFQIYQSMFESAECGFGLIHNRKYLMVNNSLAQIFDCSEEELIDSNPLEFISDLSLDKTSKKIKEIESDKSKKICFEAEVITRSGTKITIEKKLTSFIIDSEVYILEQVSDVTKERSELGSLKESEIRYRSITENLEEFMWVAERREGTIKAVFYTDSVKKITSYSSQEFLGSPLLWFRIVHPNDIKFVIKKFKSLYSNTSQNYSEIEYRIVDKIGNTVWIKNKIKVIRNIDNKIQKIFGIVSNITIQKRAEEKLKKSADDLQNLNETKDRFISIVSHDLRTPFSSILGFTDLLLTDDELDEAKKEQYIKFIQESSKHMLSLVNSLLDWTRLQTGRVEFEPDSISAKAAALNTIQIMSGAAMKKNISLQSFIDENIYVYADENLILQVFNNLVSNAIKFTEKDGEINMSAKFLADNTAVQFTVRDSGVGMKPDELNKLFSIDSKFSKNGTEGEKGSGLGLSLCRDIVHKHGGEIWVESEVGKGTQFHFTIPVSSNIILLVDSLASERTLYKKILVNLMPSYKIITAENETDAIDQIKKSKPSIIITEHHLLESTGLELIREIDKLSLRKKPRTILLTREKISDIDETYKIEDVEDFFKKPVNLNLLKRAIEENIKKSTL